MFCVMTQSSFPSFSSSATARWAAVGLRVDNEAALDEKLPLLEARLGTGEKTINGELLGVEAGPDPAGAAKIGDARFGAHPGTGEDDDPLRVRDQGGHFLNPLLHSIIGHETLPVTRMARRARRASSSKCILHFGRKRKARPKADAFRHEVRGTRIKVQIRKSPSFPLLQRGMTGRIPRGCATMSGYFLTGPPAKRIKAAKGDFTGHRSDCFFTGGAGFRVYSWTGPAA